MQTTNFRAALYGAIITVVTLFGGLLLGVAVGNFVFQILPGHSTFNPKPIHILLAALPAFAGFLGGSALWGILMGRIARAPNRKRMALAGALGFAPITVGMGMALSALEPVAVETLGAQFPIHRLFTIFFAPTAFFIAGVSACALGIGLGDIKLAWKLFWRVGLAGGLAFLIVNVVMEANGWVVGAPRAAERATMLTVMFAGNLAAALVGGAVLGAQLAKQSSATVRHVPPVMAHNS